MSWQLLKDFRPKGHAFFKNRIGQVAIADCSGKLPEDTDDGVLLVDHEECSRIDKITVPIQGNRVVTLVGEEARWFAEKDGIRT